MCGALHESTLSALLSYFSPADLSLWRFLVCPAHYTNTLRQRNTLLHSRQSVNWRMKVPLPGIIDRQMVPSSTPGRSCCALCSLPLSWLRQNSRSTLKSVVSGQPQNPLHRIHTSWKSESPHPTPARDTRLTPNEQHTYLRQARGYRRYRASR